ARRRERRRGEMSGMTGVLPIDKPVGPTAHDVVARARRAVGTRRTGHTGPLDPFAPGSLLPCLGPATRLAEYLVRPPRTSLGTMGLGVVTDTDDVQGTVMHTDDGWRAVTRDEMASTLAGFEGDQLQTPPRYSAKKVAGERMYAV